MKRIVTTSRKTTSPATRKVAYYNVRDSQGRFTKYARRANGRFTRKAAR